MSTDFLQGPRGKRQKSLPKLIPRNSQSYQLRPLNLLERDHSSLTSDQWNLLSNLVHSYDEHTTLPIAKEFLQRLNNAPAKLRFQISSREILHFSRVIYEQTEPFIRSNHDFLFSLPNADRSIVLHSAVDSVSCLSGSFLLRESSLITNSAFCQSLQNTFGSIPFHLTMTTISLLDQDPNLMKLTLSLLAFTTSSCTIFDENVSYSSVKDYRSLLRIQNIYTEAIWKYLIYRYSYCEAVVRFSHLIHCLVMTITLKTHLQSVKYHRDTVDSLVDKIKRDQSMRFNDRGLTYLSNEKSPLRSHHINSVDDIPRVK